jgi:hypothetical protein
VILFFDGLYSHISLDVIKVARKYNVALVTLTPNTTHATQPLDAGVFGPMKKGWEKILAEQRRKTHGRAVDKAVFPGLIKKLTETVVKPCHFQNSFKGAGLYPEPMAAAIQAEAVTKPSKFPHKYDTTSPFKRLHSPCLATTSAVKLQLQHHFSRLFQISATPKAKSRPKPATRVKLPYYGEVLTTDEVTKKA